MNEGKYSKIVAKMQVGAIFHIQDIQRNVLPKFTELCVEMPCCSHSEANQQGSKKLTETFYFVTEFCYGSVVLIDAFPNTRTVQVANPKLSQCFNLRDSSLGCHINATSCKRLEIQLY